MSTEARTSDPVAWPYCPKCGKHMLWHTFAKHGGKPICPTEFPSAQETPMNDKTRGIYQKYFVNRTDGSSSPGDKHDGCEYFVLDLTHDKHAAAAIKAYAESCRSEYPLLAADLDARVTPGTAGAVRGSEGDDSNMNTAFTSGPEATSSQGNHHTEDPDANGVCRVCGRSAA